MKIREITGIDGDRRDYYLYPKAVPPYEKSDYIEQVLPDRFRYHSGDGDMWPLTWAEDDMIYGGAGDNRGCPMNIWRIKTLRFLPEKLTCTGHWCMDVINEKPVDLNKYCTPAAPYVKPSGLLDIGGTLYLSIEAQNYGDNPYFCRQRNLHGWIVRSTDAGRSFDPETTPGIFSGEGCLPAISCSLEEAIRGRGTVMYMLIFPVIWRMAAAIGKITTRCCWDGFPKKN